MDTPFFLVPLLDINGPVFYAIIDALLANGLWLPRKQEYFLKKLDDKDNAKPQHTVEGEVRSTRNLASTSIIIYKKEIELVFVTFFHGLLFEPQNVFLKWQGNHFAAAPDPGFEPCRDLNREEFYQIFQQTSKSQNHFGLL